MNKDKTKMFFFNNSVLVQQRLYHEMGYTRGTLPAKYLGVLIVLNNWVFRPLNFPSNLVLMKKILQAFLNYQLSLMLIPSSVCQTLRNPWTIFFMERLSQNTKVGLVWMGKLSLPKVNGGLGLEDPSLINKAYAMKLWW